MSTNSLNFNQANMEKLEKYVIHSLLQSSISGHTGKTRFKYKFNNTTIKPSIQNLLINILSKGTIFVYSDLIFLINHFVTIFYHIDFPSEVHKTFINFETKLIYSPNSGNMLVSGNKQKYELIKETKVFKFLYQEFNDSYE